MALLIQRVETFESGPGVTFRLPDPEASIELVEKLRADLFGIAKDMGFEITGALGEAGWVPGHEARREFGIWVPTALAPRVRDALFGLGYQVVEE
jgi:hypothetical protein